MEDERLSLRVRGEAGGSIECTATGKTDGSIWYEVMVRIPGHPVWRVDLTRALHVENLAHAVSQFIDDRPDSDRIPFPVTVESGPSSGGGESIVRAATQDELEEAIRRAFETLPWS